MRKLIILGTLVIGSFTIVTAAEHYKYGQCNAIAKSTGKGCLHGVSKAGDLYCWEHMPAKTPTASPAPAPSGGSSMSR